MPRLKFIFVGKVKSKACGLLEEDYLSRLGHYASFKMCPVKDSGKADPERRRAEESAGIQKFLEPGDTAVLLDEKGKELTSEGLASFIEKRDHQGQRTLAFIVGGPYGVSGELKEKIPFTLSLSSLTLPHELARVVLLEQVYRAYTIIKGEKYHH